MHSKMGDKLIYCRSCDFCVEFSDLFEEHRKHHGAITSFQCTLCNYGALSKTYLEEHIRLDHHKSSHRQCPCCICHFKQKRRTGDTFKQQDRIDSQKTRFTPSYQEQCSSSSRQFPGNGKLSDQQRSTRVHSEKFMLPQIFLCDQCDYSHGSAHVLDLHKQHHGMDTDFICSSCNYGTFSKSSLIRHSRYHHLKRDAVRSTPSPDFKHIKNKFHESEPSEKQTIKKVRLDDSSNFFEWVYLCHHCPFWTRKVDSDVFHHHQVDKHCEANSKHYSYVARFMDVRGLGENVKVIYQSGNKY